MEILLNWHIHINNSDLKPYTLFLMQLRKVLYQNEHIIFLFSGGHIS